MILKKMNDLGEEHLCVPCKDAVISVPCYFTDAQRRDTHTWRTTITTSDIDQAIRVLNTEALYGHNPHNRENHTIKRCQLDAHWPAVEGMQPLIPEHPPVIPKDVDQEITSPDRWHIPIDAAIRKSLYCQEATTTTTTCQTSSISGATAFLYSAHIIVITALCWLRQADSNPCDFVQKYRHFYHTSFAGSEKELWLALKEGAQSEADGGSLELNLIIVTSTCPLSVFRIRIVPSYVGEMRSPLVQLSPNISLFVFHHSMLPCCHPDAIVSHPAKALVPLFFGPSLSTTSGGEWKVPQKVERL